MLCIVYTCCVHFVGISWVGEDGVSFHSMAHNLTLHSTPRPLSDSSSDSWLFSEV